MVQEELREYRTKMHHFVHAKTARVITNFGKFIYISLLENITIDFKKVI